MLAHRSFQALACPSLFTARAEMQTFWLGPLPSWVEPERSARLAVPFCVVLISTVTSRPLLVLDISQERSTCPFEALLAETVGWFGGA